jgi:hypothetical protein
MQIICLKKIVNSYKYSRKNVKVISLGKVLHSIFTPLFFEPDPSSPPKIPLYIKIKSFYNGKMNLTSKL